MRFSLVPMLLVALAGPAAAAETLLHLSETARVLARPDEITAVLRAEATAQTPAAAQARVNAAMAAAIEQARAVAGIAVATGGYAVWDQTPREPTASTSPQWHAAQTLELRGRDGEALLRLVGTLQAKGLATERLGWQLAPETARRARQEATRQALAGLRGRAGEAAELLGLRFDSFRSVRLDAAPPVAMPMLRATMKATLDATSPPSAEAEDVPVEAAVEAEAVLVPK
ncbi:conserved exported protein of unknown function [Rhodovastum atsumiense]|nr:SIMPL domain-containing protein [Rhodovastum atsumiense]CAH2604249.1 conserved exported protein of unknown function [Rhodovastum atsumiense]